MITIAVFGSSTTPPDSTEWDQAVLVGDAIARRGWAVATGGYGGTMEAVSEGAARAGGRVTGVTAPLIFPGRKGPNRHVHTEITEDTISHRIARLVEMSDAAVALPGSIGTFAELVVAWNAAFVAGARGAHPMPVVAVGRGWQVLLEAAETTLPTGAGFVRVVRDAADAIVELDRMIERIAASGR
ncbi:MAG TPA: LOG family protein [Acidimicrobiia bacterium]|nr:LOG family protein [Acidimicrobiia bacterium]